MLMIAGGALAQPVAESPVLFLNQERILTGSLAGQRLLQQEESAREALRAEARNIDAALEAEEQRLTEARSEMTASEFRALADEFDMRVVQARRDQDNRSAALAQEVEQGRRQFFGRVAPILVSLMEERGVYAIFDESAALLVDQSVNVTDAVIAELNARENAPEDGDLTPPDEATGEAE